MPTYAYKCSGEFCDHRFTDFLPVRRRNDPVGLKCPACGKKIVRDMLGEAPHTDMGYSRPIHSDAAGCHPSQVAEHRRLHPNVPIDNQGRVIFTSHSQRRKALKQLGMHDRSGFF